MDCHQLQEVRGRNVELQRSMIENKNKYHVMNYSINSFTGASEEPVNVVVVF